MPGVYTGKAGFSAHVFHSQIRTESEVIVVRWMYRIPFYRWINLLQKRPNMCHSLTWDQRIPTADVTAQINSSQHTPGQRISNITHESLHICRTYAVRPSSILSSRLVTFSWFTQSHVYLTAVYAGADINERLCLADGFERGNFLV